MNRIRQHLPLVISIAALVVALTSAGALAAHGLISGKQIKRNSITAKQVRFPRARPLAAAGAHTARARASAGVAFEQVAVLGTYTKGTDSSVLQITWDGTASAGFSPCVFQIRLDGQPAVGGEVYVGNGSTVSVSAQALFDSVKTGNHEAEVYARATTDAGTVSTPCTVDPPAAQVETTANAAELVK